MPLTKDFISSRLRFKSSLAVWAIGISFFIMIISLAISAGFRVEIRRGVSSLTGDIQLSSIHQNWYSENDPIHSEPSYFDRITGTKGVVSATPAVFRAGIVKSSNGIHGVLFKGGSDADTTSMSVSVPSKLAEEMKIGVGDRMMTYFVGEKVKIRNFTVGSIYDSILDSDESQIVHVPFADMQRLNGWEGDQASCIEIKVDDAHKSTAALKELAAELGGISLMYSNEAEDPLTASSSAERYRQLFDWLDLIDFNVLAILTLMIIVAGFNMISGLLIMLFRNIPTIGTLKALGMTDRGIEGVFLRVASGTVLKGMAFGNGAALLFCLIQGLTHVIKLNPENYFVSFVPVHVTVWQVVGVNIIAYAAIMLLLLIPCMFISKVDPAETMRVQ